MANEPKPRKVAITFGEYEAILLGMAEIETTIMAGDLEEEQLERYNRHYEALKKLVNKILKV